MVAMQFKVLQRYTFQRTWCKIGRVASPAVYGPYTICCSGSYALSFPRCCKMDNQIHFCKPKKINYETTSCSINRMDNIDLSSDIGRIPPKVAIGNEGFS